MLILYNYPNSSNKQNSYAKQVYWPVISKFSDCKIGLILEFLYVKQHAINLRYLFNHIQAAFYTLYAQE